MLYLTDREYEKMLVHCRKCFPNEACGLFGGRRVNEDKYIEKVYLLTNMDADREHFSMDPEEQLAAVHDMRRNGYELLGNFHSHPSAPSILSEEDRQFMYEAGISYMILSLQKEKYLELRAFMMEDAGVVEEPVCVLFG